MKTKNTCPTWCPCDLTYSNCRRKTISRRSVTWSPDKYRSPQATHDATPATIPSTAPKTTASVITTDFPKSAAASSGRARLYEFEFEVVIIAVLHPQAHVQPLADTRPSRLDARRIESRVVRRISVFRLGRLEEIGALVLVVDMQHHPVA